METIAPTKQGHKMEVAEAIADLREQLIAAQIQGVEKNIKFAIRSAELEMQVVLTTEAGGQGKLGWGVLSIQGSGKATDAVTHKLRLTLDIAPDSPGGRPPLIGAEADGRPRPTEPR